eukprot:886170-Amphidinium_carterae.1
MAIIIIAPSLLADSISRVKSSQRLQKELWIIMLDAYQSSNQSVDFNQVCTIGHMLMLLARVEKFVRSPTFHRLRLEGYFDPAAATRLDFRRRDVWKFLDGIAAADSELRDEGAARRLVANICELY